MVKTRSVHLYPDTPESSPKLEIALSLLESPREDKQFVLNALYDGLDLDGYAEKRLFGYDKMYGEMRHVAERIPDMSTGALNWYYNEAFVYKAGNSKLAVISRDWEYYTGGAHGMRKRDYYVFNLDDKRRLVLEDILKDDAKPALDNLVEAALRKQMEIPEWIPLTEQGFFENSVDKLEDFFLTSQGLGFQWDPYEIAPYAMGLIELVIPYDELTGLLTGSGLALVHDGR
ncbi:MAG: RsiV family protein [Treponema sp.]|nr:RsiV family protein [Treponema sp.]